MAQSNMLQPGAPRLGWLHSANTSTPPVIVLLQDTGSAIELTLPLGQFGRPGPYGPWFESLGPARVSNPAGRVPSVLLFEDVDGPIALVGCTAKSHRYSLSTGQGRLRADFAVLGARNEKYAKINGVRASMPILSAWTQLKSVQFDVSYDSRGRAENALIHLDSLEQIRLDRGVNLGLRPTWATSTDEKAGSFTAHDVVQLMTASKRPRAWQDHLDPIMAIRELTMLSAWHPFGFTEVRVNRGDDPEKVLSGDAIGDKWASVASYRLPEHNSWGKDPRFLFSFPDIGVAGVRRWLRIRKTFTRTFGPLVSLLDQGNSYAETKLLQSGLAIEALGHQLLLEKGKVKEGKRNSASYWDATEAILEDTPFKPVQDPSEWKTRSAVTYRGVKHADNEKPELLDILNAHRENVLMMRFWLASRLGTSRAVLEARLQLDPLYPPYELT